MTIEEVIKGLIDGLEEDYSELQVNTIRTRLCEVADENHLSLEELNEYCWANSSEMFACIFDGKEFCKENFEVD